MILPLTLLAFATEPAVKLIEMTPTTDEIGRDERDPAHPRYKDCSPPKNFSKRFPKTSLKKAVKKSNGGIRHEKPGPLERVNPVIGAGASSNNVYVQKFFGTSRYGHDHTYAGITHDFGKEKLYEISVSSTNYSTHSKKTIFNELAELYVKQGSEIRSYKLTGGGENGFCSWAGEGKADKCFSTATSDFAIDEATFESFANADPAKPIMVTTKRLDGTLSKCPLYYSPLSFKAPLMMIDAQYAKAVAKRERQVGERI